MRYEEFSAGLLERHTPASPVANLVVLESIDSTNRLGRELQRQAMEDESDPTVCGIVTWHQESGRGRHGRAWESAPGSGVFATLTWGCAPERLHLVPLVVATSIRASLSRYAEVALKWPNDLLLAGETPGGERRKVAGILVDALHRRGAPVYAVIGFGVNTGTLPDSAAAVGAASIGGEPPLDELTLQLLEGVAEALRALESGSDEAIVSAYAENLVHELGDPMSCRVGDVRHEGAFRGVDKRGHLRLEVDGEIVVLAAADLEGAERPVEEGEDDA